MSSEAHGVSHQNGSSPGPAAFNSPAPIRRVDDGITLSQLFGIVRENRRLVLAIGAFVFALVMTYTMLSRMMFKSTGRLYLGELQGRVTAASGELDLSAGANSEASNEIEVLRSHTMVKRAILNSSMNAIVTPRGWRAPRFGNWLLAGRDAKVLDATFAEISARGTQLEPDVTRRVEFRVQFKSPSEYTVELDDAKPAFGRLGEPLQLPGLTLNLSAGSRRGPARGAEYDLVVHPLELVAEDALKRLQVSVPKPTGAGEPARVLKLEFWNRSPHLASAFLENLMHAYLDARQAWKTEDAAAAEAFVGKQLQSMQQSLDRTQEKLARYRAENRVVLHQSEAGEMVTQVGRYEQQRVAAQLEVAALQDVAEALNQPSAPLEAYMSGEVSDPVLQQLVTALTVAREALTDVESRFKPNAPVVQQRRAKVQAQRQMIRKYVSNRLGRAKDNLAALESVVKSAERKLQTVPNAELGLTQIGRESDVYSRMYSYLLERQQQAAIVKASTVSKNRILDTPEVPFREDSPNLWLHLASGILGLLFGAAFVILRSLFSGVFHDEGELRVLMRSLPVFASIPWRLRRAAEPEVSPYPLFDVFAATPDPRFAEAFRSLRTNLYRALNTSHGKVVLVTSPTPRDGKTITALSVAAMLAADSRRVLVIDVNVRKPAHHLLTGLPRDPGLRDLVLRVESSWKSTVRTRPLAHGWIDCLSAGAPAQAEILSDGYLASLLVHLRFHYDFIILDGPSYPLVSDSLTLAPISDFVVSVMCLGNTPRDIAEEHVAGMQAVASGHAVVINNASRNSRYDYDQVRLNAVPRSVASPSPASDPAPVLLPNPNLATDRDPAPNANPVSSAASNSPANTTPAPKPGGRERPLPTSSAPTTPTNGAEHGLTDAPSKASSARASADAVSTETASPSPTETASVESNPTPSSTLDSNATGEPVPNPNLPRAQLIAALKRVV